MKNMQNSTLINLINDDIKSITSERLSPITTQDIESASDCESDCTEEIPIYINQVPRYISGVNRNTTCNDIIKALIDDELSNVKVSKQAICDPNHYTIYERYQNIEHPLGGDENIYEIWLNWGENRDQVQFKLKLNKDYCSVNERDDHQHKAKDKKIRNNGIKKLLKKVLKQGTEIQKRLIEMNEKRLESHFSEHSEYDIAQCDEFSQPSCSKWDNETIKTVTDTDDELFLIIDHHNDNDSGVFISKKEQGLYASSQMVEDEFHCYRRTPRRKFYHDRDFMLATERINSYEDFARTSCKFELMHKELRSRFDSVQEIIDQEQSLLTKIHRNSLDNLLTAHDDNTTDTFVNNISEFCDNNDTVIV